MQLEAALILREHAGLQRPDAGLVRARDEAAEQRAAHTPPPRITDATYTLVAADATYTLAVEVTATNPAGAVTTQSTPTAVVQAPPELTAVAIRGDAVVGGELSAAVTAAGVPEPKVTYQWLSSQSSPQKT